MECCKIYDVTDDQNADGSFFLFFFFFFFLVPEHVLSRPIGGSIGSQEYPLLYYSVFPSVQI